MFIIALLFSGYTAANLSDKWVYRIPMEVCGNYLPHFDDFRCQRHLGQLHLPRERCRDLIRIDRNHPLKNEWISKIKDDRLLSLSIESNLHRK